MSLRQGYRRNRLHISARGTLPSTRYACPLPSPASGASRGTTDKGARVGEGAGGARQGRRAERRGAEGCAHRRRRASTTSALRSSTAALPRHLAEGLFRFYWILDGCCHFQRGPALGIGSKERSLKQKKKIVSRELNPPGDPPWPTRRGKHTPC